MMERKVQDHCWNNAFIGSNSNLVAPLNVEPWAYIAAGSTITKAVKEGELCIARASQVNIPGWVEKKIKKINILGKL